MDDDFTSDKDRVAKIFQNELYYGWVEYKLDDGISYCCIAYDDGDDETFPADTRGFNEQRKIDNMIRLAGNSSGTVDSDAIRTASAVFC